VPTWTNLAKSQIQINDFKGAEGTIRQILVSEADDVSLHSILSFILLKQGDYNSAVRESWKTLAIDSEATDVLRVLAEVHRRAGRYERAVFYWEKYISKYEDDLEGHLALIELYSKTRQTEILDSIIGKVMVMKGGKSWRAMMNEYAEELASHAYEPDRLLLLSLIRNNLRNQ
jgi:predicted Zn-dependent protease